MFGKDNPMTIESQAQRATFSPFKGDVNYTVLTFSFATSVSLAVPIISGFNIGFTDSDHHLGRQQIELSANIHGNLGQLVDVTVVFLLRDLSGNIDDRFDGYVDVTLLVERD
jgi:hypothetical protein